MPGKLFFTVGLPRSGKSTYATNWSQFRDEKGERLMYNSLWNGESIFCGQNPRAIIAGDDFRTAIHGQPYIYESECLVFSAMDVAARALLLRGFDVLIDETCTTEQTLYRYLKLDLDAQPIFIDTPAEVCLERAVASGRWYLDGPIKAMAKQLTMLKANWNETYCRLRRQIIERYPTQYQQESKV